MPLRPWIVIGAVLVGAAAAAVAIAPATVLQVDNAATGRTIRLAVAGERFTVTYQHSMYDQPVTEEFTEGPGGSIRLLSVSSPSAAVREYFGLTTAGEWHAVDRTFPELVVRIAVGAEQHLRTGPLERSFLDFGAHGDRLVLHLVRSPALLLLLDHAVAKP